MCVPKCVIYYNMLKIIRNLSIILVILICAALGALAGWFAREKLSPPVPDGSISEKTFSAPMALPGEDQGIVSFLSGSGFRKRNYNWDELEPGMLVADGDSVRTAEGGAADVQFGGLAVVRLRQNSAASFENIRTRQRDGRLSVRIDAGTVLFNVTKGAGRVTVVTPDGKLSVVGTEFLVTVGQNGTYTAVRDGTIEIDKGAAVEAGYSVRIGKNADAAPKLLSAAAKADTDELKTLRLLDIPAQGTPLRLARIIVETSPADSTLFRSGEALGRGSAALLVPFGETVKLTASKAGFKTKDLEIKVAGDDAEKRYSIRLEPDPGAEITSQPEEHLGHIMKLEMRIGLLESELETKELLYRAVSTQSSNLGTERDIILRDAEASRKAVDAARAESNAVKLQITALEAQIKALNVALEQEKERVRQIQELLKN